MQGLFVIRWKVEILYWMVIRSLRRQQLIRATVAAGAMIGKIESGTLTITSVSNGIEGLEVTSASGYAEALWRNDRSGISSS